MMKKMIWFTHTNIDTREVKIHNDPKITVDLSDYINVFIKNEIWKRSKYRNEYVKEYKNEDFAKVKSVKIHLHSEGDPYSNLHSYEKLISKYIPDGSIERSKITSSAIGEANRIAVIELEFESDLKVIDYLSHEDEMDIDKTFDIYLSTENIESWNEISRIKAIACEFIQFYMFNMHLNFPSINYSFAFTDKPFQIGYTVLTDYDTYYYETDKIDFLSHYIFYESDKDQLKELMNKTANFWHIEIVGIHFFLNALRGSYISIDNFSRLVFSLESFFGRNTSNDFITLSIPFLLGKDIHSMKEIREILKKSFQIRNQYVHGGKVKEDDWKEMFFKLKNIVIELFLFYVEGDLFLSRQNEKVNHEMMFKYLVKVKKQKG